MTNTQTLLVSGEDSAQSTDILPLTRADFVEIDYTGPKAGNIVAAREWRANASAVDEDYDVVLRSVLKSTTVWHPGKPANKREGLMHEISLFTAVEETDDVVTYRLYHPMFVKLAIGHSGATLRTPGDVLDLVLSTALFLFRTASAGDPSTTVITNVAHSETDIIT